MKSFERILKDETISLIGSKLDPLEFAYQTGKWVKELFILDRLYKHLERPKTHARLLFADFNSAFNEMELHILVEETGFSFYVTR